MADLNSKWAGKKVIIRASGAGCHFGTVENVEGSTVTLTHSRRLWRWWSRENGSLSAVAKHGIDVAKSNIGDPVTITIFDAHEIIEVSEEAAATIEAGKWTR